MRSKVTHGMTTAKARRVQLTGNQLKKKFINDFTSDGLITCDINLKFLNQFLPSTFSLKSGDNWQFRLGNFIEIEKIGYVLRKDGKQVVYNSEEKLKELFYSGRMFSKYAFPHKIFVCLDNAKWLFFDTSEVLEYINDNIRVRLLDSGRIKIDLLDVLNEKYMAVFTLEYRSEVHKKSFVFGSHGGNSGKKLRKILMSNCNYMDYSLFSSSTK